MGQRFPLELPMRVLRHDCQTPLKGVTSDLSAVGLHFTAETALEVGSAVEFEIPLPAEMLGGSEVVIRCLGRVVREDAPEEADPGHHGMACVIDWYELVRSSKPWDKGGETCTS
jgi:hypothetical protein